MQQKMDEEVIAALVRYVEKKPTYMYTLEVIGWQAHLLERPENDSSDVEFRGHPDDAEGLRQLDDGRRDSAANHA